MSPKIKKVAKILMYLLLSLVLLFLLLVAVINLPIVHKAITKKANAVLLENEIPLHIGKISLLINGNIGVNELEIIVPPSDTIVYAGKVSVDISMLPLLSKKIVLDQLTLKDAVAKIETDTVTGEMNIVSIFNSNVNAAPAPEVEATNSENQWDFSVNSIRLKNIQVQYNDPVIGILLEEKLANAEIDFDTFSFIEKQIKADKILIEKSAGTITIWDGSSNQVKESGSTPEWKFSAKNFEISDLVFTLNQPDIGQHINFDLKKGNISLDNFALAESKILISKIELVEPKVIYAVDSTITNKITEEPESVSFSIPSIPWEIVVEKFKIKDGFLDYKTADKTQNETLKKWLPVKELNAEFDNTQITPNRYNLNLEEISFALSNALNIKSGSLKFMSDSLQNMGLQMELAALMKNNKKGWFAKDSLLTFTADLSGSTEELKIKKMDLSSSSGLELFIGGTLLDPLEMPQSQCNISLKSSSISRNQLAPIVKLFSPETNLPTFKPFTVSGSVKNSLDFPLLALNIKSGSGNINAGGNYNLKSAKGKLEISFSDILLSELMGETYPETLTGKLELKGGLNKNNLPEGVAFLQIDSVRYKNKTTSDISIHAEVLGDNANIEIQSKDPALILDLSGQFAFNEKSEYSGTVNGYFDIDLYKMQLIPNQFAGKGKLTSNFEYSPKEIIASVGLNDFTISNVLDTAIIGKMQFAIHSSDSIINSKFESKMLLANFESHATFADFTNAFNATDFNNIVNLDSTNFINLAAISNLKDFDFDVTVRHTPFFNLFYPDSVLNFSDIKLQIKKSGKDSIAQAKFHTEWINYNDIKSYNPQLIASAEPDRLTFEIKIDSIVGKQAKSGKMGVNLNVLPANISGKFFIVDKSDSILNMIGIEAERKNDLVVFKSSTPDWIINKINYAVLPREFLSWDQANQIFAANLKIHSGEKQIELLGKNTEKVELGIKNIDLKSLEIPGITGFIPNGTLNVDLKYSKTESHNLEANLEINQMKWGDISFNKIAANGHLIADSTGIAESDLTISTDDSPLLTAQMKSNEAKNGYTVKSSFNQLQFQLFEPFISEYANNLNGTTSGEITIDSKDDKIEMNGEIRFKNFGLEIIPLKTSLIIPDNKIELKQNQFIFNEFKVLDSLMRPLTVNGKINYINSDDIKADLKVKADKIMLMNTPQSNQAPLFGKVIVDSDLSIEGSIFSPSIKGNVELESGTNLTYQLIQDLSVQSSQTDVVFATITDSLQIIYDENEIAAKPTKMPMIETSISINSNSIFKVKIDDFYGVDISISGNGLLNYNMLPNNTMSLNGDYNITAGDCELKITGWPLKDFDITPGSSLNWNGSIENPELNIEATSKVRGSYFNPIDGKTRMVDFVVSMKMQNQLSELGITFDVQSTDQYITSIVNSLSDDEKMRQAVNLLLFETIDLPGIQKTSNYISSQINSFWESQLNALTSTTLNKTKLSFGIDNYNEANASGKQEEKTTVTYEMERKFMNDRATVRLSGRLNDYNEGAYQTNSLFENFIFEYALDSLNTKNIKIYQKRDYEDMLEGEVVKNGIGFLYRKNFKKISDIWRREKKKK